jgi:hypothetical protein
MDDKKYIQALKLVLEELENPSRDLRISSQVFDCKTEMYTICEWLSKEVRREIDLREMFEDWQKGG